MGKDDQSEFFFFKKLVLLNIRKMLFNFFFIIY